MDYPHEIVIIVITALITHTVLLSGLYYVLTLYWNSVMVTVAASPMNPKFTAIYSRLW